MQLVQFAVMTIVAYLIGSFPTGYLAARFFKGVDPRQHGSGRTGGTNILRTAGKGAALTTVIGDLLKGLLAVLLARFWIGTQAAEVVAGLAAVLGHNRSIFLGFRGGAGSMTNVGALLAMAPYVVPFAAAAAFVSGKLSRTASLVSIAAAATSIVVLAVGYLLSFTPVAYLIYGVLAGVLILFELRPNLRRLSNGTERRVENY